MKYRKILKTYFSKALFEGLILGEAYIRRTWREICISKSIGLALKLEVNLSFLLCFTLHLRAIFQVQANGGRDNVTDGFFVTSLGGLYLEGLIFRISLYMK